MIPLLFTLLPDYTGEWKTDWQRDRMQLKTMDLQETGKNQA
jgi:hypothetical protein